MESQFRKKPMVSGSMVDGPHAPTSGRTERGRGVSVSRPLRGEDGGKHPLKPMLSNSFLLLLVRHLLLVAMHLLLIASCY